MRESENKVHTHKHKEKKRKKRWKNYRQTKTEKRQKKIKQCKKKTNMFLMVWLIVATSTGTSSARPSLLTSLTVIPLLSDMPCAAENKNLKVVMTNLKVCDQKEKPATKTSFKKTNKKREANRWQISEWTQVFIYYNCVIQRNCLPEKVSQQVFRYCRQKCLATGFSLSSAKNVT